MPVLYRHISNNQVFYIGIGKKESRAYSKSNRNQDWHNVVNSNGYEVEVLYKDNNYDLIKEKEVEFIELYGRIKDGGTLVNRTSGGQGVMGLKHSEESRKKMSESAKGKAVWNKGKKGLQEAWNKNRKMPTITGSKNHQCYKYSIQFPDGRIEYYETLLDSAKKYNTNNRNICRYLNGTRTPSKKSKLYNCIFKKE